ncbi:EF hand family protein [Trichomonas vaginalis G3]|uniref:EF hand family protein n=1 Tax=Trichomonas vaginalis (strain ATCC PRA-98 / G3) TaxID=412133 RepID=A2F622_TRIV3|nr:calcyphosin family [Trichomonas vaginalis G3]EAX99651.1 EF hand family protein [Trichomonas vaginalis G3]KAI5522424.1 calcyphosin family [Trichomonas vaginalis G3]|eukprot:XP_001312581.1 EF hand family protein [Trichomonas vaginalis G3]
MTVKEVSEKLRRLINEKYTIDQVGKVLSAADQNHDGYIDQKENFAQVMRELGIQLTDRETRSAAKALGATEQGIRIDTFLAFFSPAIPKERMKFIQDAYKKLDTDGDDVVDIDELVTRFGDGDFVNFFGRRMTKEMFKSHMMKCFDADRDGKFQLSGFSTYFQEYSQYIKSDEEWANVMNGMWGLAQ